MPHVDQSSPAYMQRRASTFAKMPHCERRRHVRKQRAIAYRDGLILREVLIALYGNACMACGSTHRLTVDHILPLSKGGRTVIENLQLLCQFCNKQKSNWTMDFREET